MSVERARVEGENVILVKIHDPDMTFPELYDKGDWVDLRSAECVDMKAGEYRLISLGVSMKLPEGYEAHLAVRSSTFKKFKIIQTNGVGIIDNSYCGDDDIWKLPVYAVADTRIPFNERIAQFRILKKQPKLTLVETAHLLDENRSGFGSTDELEATDSRDTVERLARTTFPLDPLDQSNFGYLEIAANNPKTKVLLDKNLIMVGVMPSFEGESIIRGTIGTVENNQTEWKDKGVEVVLNEKVLDFLYRLTPMNRPFYAAPVFVHKEIKDGYGCLSGFYLSNEFSDAGVRYVAVRTRIPDLFTGINRPFTVTDLYDMHVTQPNEISIDDLLVHTHVTIELPIHQSLPVCSTNFGARIISIDDDGKTTFVVPEQLLARLVTDDQLEIDPRQMEFWLKKMIHTNKKIDITKELLYDVDHDDKQTGCSKMQTLYLTFRIVG